MKLIRAVAAVLALIGASIAPADVVFSNVTIAGSLVSGASFSTGANDIDFLFPDATVGDPVDPRRIGNIILTYEAMSDQGIDLDQMFLSVLGALSGSGKIFFNEVIEDVANPGIIGSYSVMLDAQTPLPLVATIPFDRASTHIKVKKTAVLVAPPTSELDLANVSLIEQKLREVPEPATALALALSGLIVLRRR